MRALGPGSVSSFLKIILDVVYAALWVVVGVLLLVTVVAALLTFNPGLLDDTTLATGRFIASLPMRTGALLAYALNLIGVLLIIGALRRIFSTLTAGDPFHPENVRRLRLIGVILAALELGRYLVWGVAAWLFPLAARTEPALNLTAWFSVLVVFVLAEVFREGARLRREAELTI